jgi:hypothetical protein
MNDGTNDYLYYTTDFNLTYASAVTLTFYAVLNGYESDSLVLNVLASDGTYKISRNY